MKYRTTKKAVNGGYVNRIYVGYCALHSMLSHTQETSYIARREGWACDIYDFGNTAIITGYAPFGNIKVGYETCKRYEKAADEIRNKYRTDWNAATVELDKLIHEFIKEVTKQ